MQPAMASPSLTEEKHAATSRPYYSNWFFSLRRQPRKNKKNASAASESLSTDGVVGASNGVPLQRSCIDLSGANSVFYLTSPLDLQTPHKDFSELGSASTDNIYEDEQSTRRRVRTMTQLCAPCCCPGKSTLPATTINVRQESTLKDSTTTGKYSTLQEAPVTTPPSPSNRVSVLSQHSEFLRTTTVTTTRTLIITRPVEVLLNEKGEIMSRRSAFNSVSRNRRSNSLGCMLDECVETEGVTGVTSGGNVFNTGSVPDALRPGVLASCDDLQFIDDNANSDMRKATNNDLNKNVVNQAELRNQTAVIMRNNNKVHTNVVKIH